MRNVAQTQAPIPPCFDEDCGFVTSKCDVGSGICYECQLRKTASGVCINNECVACLVDGDCEAGRCLETNVECVDNSDCQTGNVCSVCLWSRILLG